MEQIGQRVTRRAWHWGHRGTRRVRCGRRGCFRLNLRSGNAFRGTRTALGNGPVEFQGDRPGRGGVALGYGHPGQRGPAQHVHACPAFQDRIGHHGPNPRLRQLVHQQARLGADPAAYTTVGSWSSSPSIRGVLLDHSCSYAGWAFCATLAALIAYYIPPDSDISNGFT